MPAEVISMPPQRPIVITLAACPTFVGDRLLMAKPPPLLYWLGERLLGSRLDSIQIEISLQRDGSCGSFSFGGFASGV